MLLLVYAFLTFDFSVRYVANNTNRGTPFYYRITALWGALEGSIILWAWMLSLYTLIVVGRYRRTQPQLYPWVARGDARHLRLLPPGDDDPGAALRAALARSPPTAAASTRCSKTPA